MESAQSGDSKEYQIDKYVQPLSTQRKEELVKPMFNINVSM